MTDGTEDDLCNDCGLPCWDGCECDQEDEEEIPEIVSNVPEHQFESMNTSNKERLLYSMVDPPKIK